MAVTQISEREFIGLAGDSKPAAALNAKFYETDTGRTYVYTGSWIRLLAPAAVGTRGDFLSKLMTLLGDVRLLWTPDVTDAATSTDQSLNARTITHQGGSVATRLSRLGLGYAASFDGVTPQYATAPDAANLSFGTGAADSPFSIIALARVADTAAARRILSKEAASNNEYFFGIDASDRLVMGMIDQSAAAATESKFTTSAITQGAWQLFAGTYSAAVGGGSASGDISLYVNGQVISATTLSDSGVYVAMENLTGVVSIGGMAAGGSPFNGSLALVALTAKNLAAWEHWAIYQLLRSYFDF